MSRACPLPLQELWWTGGEGCPYRAAAKHGDLAMLRCLKRVGYPMTGSNHFLNMAIDEEYRMEVLRWLLDNRVQVDWNEVEWLDKEFRSAWRHRWSERSLWINSMWQQAKAQEGARGQAAGKVQGMQATD